MTKFKVPKITQEFLSFELPVYFLVNNQVYVSILEDYTLQLYHYDEHNKILSFRIMKCQLRDSIIVYLNDFLAKDRLRQMNIDNFELIDKEMFTEKLKEYKINIGD